jgi:hypothetical protein
MNLPSGFWARTRISPIPALDILRNTIIQARPPRLQEEGKKFRWPAMPKWHFRLATGTLVHLQPKINPFNGFEGTAEILIDGVGIFYLTFRIIITMKGSGSSSRGRTDHHMKIVFGWNPRTMPLKPPQYVNGLWLRLAMASPN